MAKKAVSRSRKPAAKRAVKAKKKTAKKTVSRKKATRSEAPPLAKEPPQTEQHPQPAPPAPVVELPATNESVISIKVSNTLAEKLRNSAQEEGIELDAFAAELLSEGIVLRAWEIIERKSAMRGGNQIDHAVAQRHGNHIGGGGGGGNRNRRNRRGKGGGAWMEDKAAFLEYVRNQEKRGM